MYRVRGQFIAYVLVYSLSGGLIRSVSCNELRRGRDTSGPYDVLIHHTELHPELACYTC